jgi:SAM-dependent methyltransferase
MPALDYRQVADLYDRFVKTDLDVAFFTAEAQKVPGQVLELMCGTGRLTLPLLGSGIPLTCVDSSAEMLAQLHKKLAGSSNRPIVVEQDIVHLSLPTRYDLALIPFNSFSEITSVPEEIEALASIRRHLTAKGKLIVTLHNPTVRLGRVDGRPHLLGSFPLDDGGNKFTVTLCEEYDSSTHLVRGREVFEASGVSGELIWQRDVPIAFRLIPLEEFENLALKAGFAIESVYGDYSKSEYRPADSPFLICTLRIM